MKRRSLRIAFFIVRLEPDGSFKKCVVEVKPGNPYGP